MGQHSVDLGSGELILTSTFDETVTTTTPKMQLQPTPVSSAVGVGCSVDRSGWTNTAEHLTLSVETSSDGGQSWRASGGVLAAGGTTTGPNGVPAPESSLTITTPTPGVMIRTVAVSNGSVTRPLKLRVVL